MKPEYHEGPEALERFEKGMTKLFQATPPKKQTPKPARKPKAKATSKD